MPAKTEFMAKFRLDDAHVWRSKIVEKCAMAERAIVALLSKRGIDTGGKAPLSQKIEKLRKIVGDAPAKRSDRTLRQTLDELVPLAELRSELAHSTTALAVIDGERFIILRNAGDKHPEVDRRVVIAIDKMNEISRRLNAVANRLKQAAG
jgi:hypothetical protein